MTMPPQTPLPDAARANWVDRFAPEPLRPWLRLGRFDRPVGIWLLFLPGAMGLCLAWNGDPGTFPVWEMCLFAAGSALMRAAGCAYNDLVDRDIDARVERTRSRPIPAGQISPRQAAVYVIVCCLISLTILLQLGWTAIWLGVGSLGLVAAYPFMKRITWWPQAWLGLTFNWGLPMGVAAVTGEAGLSTWLFYAGLVAWTIGYDTIYAIQDMEDDALIGVRSSARAMGPRIRTGVAVGFAVATLLTGIGAFMAFVHWPFFVGLLLVGAHFMWQVRRLDSGNAGLALRLFRANRTTGLLWVAALIAGRLF